MTGRRFMNWVRSRLHFLYGGLTLIPGFPPNLLWRHTGGTVSARYCYSVWMRHLINSAAFGGEVPKVVAELGPGDSIGIGLAALLSGSDRYLAFDVVRYADLSLSISIFDELVVLFQARAPVPSEDEFQEVKPPLQDYSFPSKILTDALLEETLAEERLLKIRAALQSGESDEAFISYRAPWSSSSVVEADSVDFIFSQAVMEHVDDVESAYAAMRQWLKANGLASHQVDFKSHGLTLRWDGLRALNRWRWKILRGKRPYLVNRLTCIDHLIALEKRGFKILKCERFMRPAEVPREELAKEFQALSDLERETAGAYFLICKCESLPQGESFEQHGK